jgi:hypothetical protein
MIIFFLVFEKKKKRQLSIFRFFFSTEKKEHDREGEKNSAFFSSLLTKHLDVQRINQKVFFLFLPSNASSSRDNPSAVGVVPLLVGALRELVGVAPVPPFRSSN